MMTTTTTKRSATKNSVNGRRYPISQGEANRIRFANLANGVRFTMYGKTVHGTYVTGPTYRKESQDQVTSVVDYQRWNPETDTAIFGDSSILIPEGSRCFMLFDITTADFVLEEVYQFGGPVGAQRGLTMRAMAGKFDRPFVVAIYRPAGETDHDAPDVLGRFATIKEARKAWPAARKVAEAGGYVKVGVKFD